MPTKSRNRKSLYAGTVLVNEDGREAVIGDSVHDFIDQYGGNYCHLLGVLRGQYKRSGDWRLAQPPVKPTVRVVRKGLWLIMMSPAGNIYRFDSLSAAARRIRRDISTVRRWVRCAKKSGRQIGDWEILDAHPDL